MKHSNLWVLHVGMEFEPSFTVDDLLDRPIWATNVSNYFRSLILLLTFFFCYDHSLEKRIFISVGPNGIFLANRRFNFPKNDLFVLTCAYEARVVFKPCNLSNLGLVSFEGLTDLAFPKFDQMHLVFTVIHCINVTSICKFYLWGALYRNWMVCFDPVAKNAVVLDAVKVSHDEVKTAWVQLNSLHRVIQIGHILQFERTRWSRVNPNHKCVVLGRGDQNGVFETRSHASDRMSMERRRQVRNFAKFFGFVLLDSHSKQLLLLSCVDEPIARFCHGSDWEIRLVFLFFQNIEPLGILCVNTFRKRALTELKRLFLLTSRFKEHKLALLVGN